MRQKRVTSDIEIADTTKQIKNRAFTRHQKFYGHHNKVHIYTQKNHRNSKPWRRVKSHFPIQLFGRHSWYWSRASTKFVWKIGEVYDCRSPLSRLARYHHKISILQYPLCFFVRPMLGKFYQLDYDGFHAVM